MQEKSVQRNQFLDRVDKKKKKQPTCNKSENPATDIIILKVLNIYEILHVLELRRKDDGFQCPYQ